MAILLFQRLLHRERFYHCFHIIPERIEHRASAACIHLLLDLRSTFVGGAEVDRFECDWATTCGTRFAIGVGNGTDAIAVTLRALGIGRGDEVIVPTNTFVATVEAVVLAGATPRFVDVDARTLLVTPE